MDTKITNGLGEEYSWLLLASESEKNVKQEKRYDTILLYMEGYARKQIAEILHIPTGLSAAILPATRKAE